MNASSMKTPPSRRLRWCTILLLAGLAVEAASLAGLHSPMGFLSFALVGGALIAAAILLYLWSFVLRQPEGQE